MVFKKTVLAYYQLSKPGIIYGNILSAVGGYFFASRWHIHWMTFFGMLIGTSLVIACGCAYNNYLDRGIDKKMARTKKRPTVTGAISGRNAILFGTISGLIGFTLIWFAVNTTVFVIGLIGLIDYVILYGYTKRHTAYSTLVGSISGATPVVAGYCAAAGHFDLGAFLVGLILVLWQMPHFYAISLYRRSDYAAAGIPALGVVASASRTKQSILIYIGAFILAVGLLSALSYAGYLFAAVMLSLGLIWLWRGLQTLHTLEDAAWGKRMFLFSLIVITSLSGMLAVGSILP